MRETLEQMVARISANAFIAPEFVLEGESKMAKPVKLTKGREFTFAAPKSGGGGESKYPWDEWFNGDLLMLEQSVGTADEKGTITVGPNKGDKRDYEVATDAMPAKLKTAARRRYKVVQISRVDADNKRLVGALIIKARDMTADEKVAEDILRAEEKEDLIAKKKAKADAAATAAATTPPAGPTLATGTA